MGVVTVVALTPVVDTETDSVSQLSIILSDDFLCQNRELAGVKGSKGKLKVVMKLDGSPLGTYHGDTVL